MVAVTKMAVRAVGNKIILRVDAGIRHIGAVGKHASRIIQQTVIMALQAIYTGRIIRTVVDLSVAFRAGRCNRVMNVDLVGG